MSGEIKRFYVTRFDAKDAVQNQEIPEENSTPAKGGKRFGKSHLVTLLSLLMGGILAHLFISHGFTEETYKTSLSATGRISYPIFLLIFAASSLQKLFPCAFTRWVCANRRDLGFAFAIAYAYHAIGFFGLLSLKGDFGIDGLEFILSIISYIFIVLMSITSFPAVKRQISPWLWNSIHTLGMYVFWYFFLQEFMHRAEETSDWFYLPLTLMNVLVLILRIIAASKPGKSSNRLSTFS
ncbi:hypothetical protein [Calothrix sp. 336/3]|uniref:hypothetical protein n=1 Tax=Calothrix sp. 336/3 TaxID=1337936 RepID=UPI0004E2C93F|nr:hypothetical protein [Calothrix sp. 336/3]AKG22035.1 hypothetical protein IJ00_12905 [Calothrix sp. 336/3]